MADRIDFNSKSSSNTSAGDSEITLKRTTSFVAESPRQGMNTPVKTVINVIPAEENNSPKRPRYEGVEAEESTIPKKNHNDDQESLDQKNKLAPPPVERPSITISSADSIRPVALFTSPSPSGASNTLSQMGGSQGSSSTQNAAQFSSPVPNSLSGQNKPLFQAGPGSSVQPGFTGSFGQFSAGTPSLFAGSSNSSAQMTSSAFKYSQKCAILFGVSGQNPQNQRIAFKSEAEKERILFESSGFEPKPANLPNFPKAHKDPHGLDWLEAESLAKTEVKRKEFRFEEVKLKKKDGKNPFELILPNKQPSQVFKALSYCSEYNPPSVSIDLVLKDQEVSQKIVKKKTFSLPFGYETRPSLEELNRMTEEALASVHGFSIQNEFGCIRFDSTVNLNQVDLANDVFIEKGKILAYSRKQVPDVGTGLNQSALVSLFHCVPCKPIPVSDFVDVLTELCKQFESKFVSWDKKTGKWVFRVKNLQHFHNM